MNSCDSCNGACCRWWILPLAILDAIPADAERWLRFHLEQHPRGLIIPVSCQMLNSEGKCSIYDHRPQVCVDFKVDGADCREARTLSIRR
jgi:Fe-S-cluster containining protein